MGTGPGGASAGFGPDLCITATRSLPSEPCDDCYDVATVQQEVGAPAVCPEMDFDDHITRYPCVKDAGGSYDRGVHIYGFVNEDRNQEVAQFHVRAEVEGVRVELSTAFRTLSANDTLIVRRDEVCVFLVSGSRPRFDVFGATRRAAGQARCCEHRDLRGESTS